MVTLCTFVASQSPAYAVQTSGPGTAAAWAYDSDRNVLVAVEGSPAGVWEWSGATWQPRLGATNLPPSVRHAAYDPIHRLLLADGSRAWDGVRWVTGPAAPTTYGTPLLVGAYDVVRRRYVMPTTTHVLEWDGGLWYAIPATGGPGSRSGCGFAYDLPNGRCVLYGGGTTSGATAEVWSWDGSAWTLLDANAAPGPRLGATLAADPANNRLLLYGGGPTTTWTFANGTWTQHATSRDPGDRSQPRLAYDGTGMLLGGGDPLNDLRNQELWRFQNGNWVELSPIAPAPRSQASLAYDPVRKETVLFGGFRSASAFLTYDETWVWNGSWSPYRGSPRPTAQAAAAMCWSDADQALLLFGAGGETWNWLGTGWQQRTPATSPTARQFPVLQPDPAGGVLLFGGRDVTTFTFYDDHWHWNGSNWSLVNPALRPSPRQGIAALDPLRQVVVLAGGYSNNLSIQDTWEWNGSQWNQRTAPPVAIGLLAERMAFDPQAGKVRLEALQTHLWDGLTWTSLVGSQPATNAAGLTTDTVRGVVLRHGLNGTNLAALTLTPATAVRVGGGCALGRSPGVSTLGRPTFGNADFRLVASTFAPGAPAFLALGLSQASVPLGSGCSQLVGTVLATSFFVASPSGEDALPLALPNDPTLRGVQITTQLAVVDPPRSLFAGLTLSAALTTTIGD